MLDVCVSTQVAETLGEGRDAVTFSKGTGKDRGAGQKTTVLRFLKGDVKKVLLDQRVVSTESIPAFSFSSGPPTIGKASVHLLPLGLKDEASGPLGGLDALGCEIPN